MREFVILIHSNLQRRKNSKKNYYAERQRAQNLKNINIEIRLKTKSTGCLKR